MIQQYIRPVKSNTLLHCLKVPEEEGCITNPCGESVLDSRLPLVYPLEIFLLFVKTLGIFDQCSV